MGYVIPRQVLGLVRLQFVTIHFFQTPGGLYFVVFLFRPFPVCLVFLGFQLGPTHSCVPGELLDFIIIDLGKSRGITYDRRSTEQLIIRSCIWLNWITWSGFVKWYTTIYLVGQYIILTYPLFTWTLMKKYLMLRFLPLVYNCMTLLLPWWIMVVFGMYSWSLMKRSDHIIMIMESSTTTISDYVEFHNPPLIHRNDAACMNLEIWMYQEIGIQPPWTQVQAYLCLQF